MTRSDGKDELVEQFIATTADALAEIGEQVALLSEAKEPDEYVKKIGRGLHTLKGESRLLELGTIEKITHLAEEVLYSHQRAGSPQDVAPLLYEALDAVFVCVQDRASDRETSEELIESLLVRLMESVIPEEEVLDAEEESEDEEAQAEETPATAPAQSASDQRNVYVNTDLLDKITDLVSDISGGLIRNMQYLDNLDDLKENMHKIVVRGERPAQVGQPQEQDGLQTDETKAPDDEVLSAVVLPKVLQHFKEVMRDFREHSFRLNLIYSELTEKVRESRLQPLHTAFVRYPPFIRRCAREENKRIRLRTTGGGVGIEQRVLEEIAEPCLHMLRNAIIHGIESPQERTRMGKPEEGVISIEAQQDGGLIRLRFADDGRGIDTRRVLRRARMQGLLSEEQAEQLTPVQVMNLVFVSGLSTVAEASQMAGRGVGLDVVQSTIDRLGGTVRLASQPGQGTEFVIQVPVSMSLSRALLVKSSDQIFAVPNPSIVDLFRLPVRDIRFVEGRETTMFRGSLLPLVRLRDVLNLRGIKDLFVNKVGVVVVRSGDEMAGFIVDIFIGEREIVARPFGAYLGRPKTVNGYTLMENGDVVLILHAPDLIKSIHEHHTQAIPQAHKTASDEEEQRILFVEDSLITREYASGVLRSRGYYVAVASDGIEALELLKGEKFDVILTDLQMPRMDGFKLCATVRKTPGIKSLPIVVLSTIETPEAKRMALDAGADVYLVKSAYSADVLLSTIRQVLD